ncbi:Phosphatidylglycerophosphatase A [Alphaproteobacteria bacterium SO-S41]|nr:Phosphatidylglycerophosphatase A [Alphaproteobacteria bacterium SO-S41]
MVRSWWGLLGSGFAIGLIPLAPGTWASAATLPLGWLIAAYFGPIGVLVASLVVFAIGVIVAGHIINHTKVEDASVIVIDEIAGQLLVLAASALTWQAYLVGFLLFRLFDILKPWPASLADRELGGGLGVMVDDMVAGLYGAVVMLCLGALWLNVI